ncbi:carbohydrate ABC transporter permease [Vallitalea okinawensis]|uniref:carbohydrate ABC transporter permease n=1 Tax=Vallitalea okinawensis TaxID=2078660 RepID=UPI000CFAE14C|nr:carbohydrate ABC transporter permease [Vallitalea okinawensis]
MKERYYKKNISNKVFDLFNILFMVIFSFIMLYPFWNQLVLSLNDGLDAMKGGIYFWPRLFSTDAYKMLFEDGNLIKGALVSVLRVVFGTGTCLIATGLLSYVLTVKSFSGKKIIRIIFIFTMYFSGGLIPFYLLIVKLGMTDTFSVYWLPGLVNVYYMLIISSYMQNLPESISESARIDGCSELRIFFQIIFPISKPVFAAIAVYLAVGHWNAWFDALIYNPSGNWDTLQVYLRRLLLEAEAVNQVQNAQLAQNEYRNLSPETLRAAATMVVTLPIVMVYPFFQKYFVSGITLGSVKG